MVRVAAGILLALLVFDQVMLNGKYTTSGWQISRAMLHHFRIL
jgi:hypothetical protein